MSLCGEVGVVDFEEEARRGGRLWVGGVGC